MTGNLFVVSGPSGSGKSTICKGVVQQDKRCRLSVSATTRTPREGEVNGVSYYFLSKEEFAHRVDAGEFYEHAVVYENRYGTLKKPVNDMLEEGYDVILEIDIQGGLQIQKVNPSAVLIFILPPSVEELARRLTARNSETEEQFALRLSLAKAEIEKKKLYDHQVTNVDLGKAIDEVCAIIASYRERR